MKYFNEYVHFVVGAKIAGCDIETEGGLPNNDFVITDTPLWNWADCSYRIKLPKGWEYVIEDGEIAFREPNEGEWCLTNDYVKALAIVNGNSLFNYCKDKRPIIRKIK